MGPGNNTAMRPRTDRSPARTITHATAPACTLTPGMRHGRRKDTDLRRRPDEPPAASSRRRCTSPESQNNTMASAARAPSQLAAAPGRPERLPHERRLAVAARRDEEDLLGRRQVGHQAVELGFAVGEGLVRDDFPVDERVLHGVTLDDV